MEVPLSFLFANAIIDHMAGRFTSQALATSLIVLIAKRRNLHADAAIVLRSIPRRAYNWLANTLLACEVAQLALQTGIIEKDSNTVHERHPPALAFEQ